MKWTLSYRSAGIHHWQLQDENSEANLDYNLQNASLRINGNIKRLFFLETIGLIQKKLQLKTEYGVVIGEMSLLNKLTNGAFILNDRKYYYYMENGRLTIFDKSKKQLATSLINLFRNVDIKEHLALLFSFTWLTVVDSQKQKMV